MTPKTGTQESDYAFTFEPGTLTITNATLIGVTLTGTTATYNGAAHYATLTGTQSGDTIEYRTSTNGGTTWSTWSSTEPSVTHVSDGPLQVEVKVSRANYNDATDTATLTITKQAIELTADSKSWTYNGDEHTQHSYKITDGSFVNDEGLASATFAAASAITNVGSVANTITGVTPKTGTQESDYAFTFKAGMLTVTKSKLMTVSAIPYTGKYDGAGHSITASASIPAGTTLYYNTTGGTNLANYSTTNPSIKNVADSKTIYVAAVNPNYETAYASAAVTITKRAVLLTSGSASKMYDGSALTSRDVTITGDGFVSGEGYMIAPIATGLIINVGSTTNSIYQWSLKTNTKSSNYTITKSEGTLTVTKSNRLTVNASSYNAKYDGLPHMLVPIPSVLVATAIYYSLTGGAYPGDYTLVPPTAWNVADSKPVYIAAVNPNYETAYTSASLAITKRTVTLTSDSASKMYDGVPLTKAGVSLGGDGFVLLQGFIDTPSGSGTITNVGSTANTIQVPTLRHNTNVGNYDITKIEGTLMVTPSDTLRVNVVGHTGIYDGNTYYVSATPSETSGTTLYYSTIGGTNLANYSTANPGVKNVSESKTVFVAAVNSNYKPAFGQATITIEKRTVILRSVTTDKVFDNTALTSSVVEIQGDGFVAGEGFVTPPTADGSIINFGTTNNTIVVPALNASTAANDYEISQTIGTLSITPRTVTIVMDPSQKNYGDVDPAFTYSFKTGAGYYDVIADTGITIMTSRTDLLAPTGQDVGVHSLMMTANTVAENATAEANYTFFVENADFTINPQVVYGANTTDVVTGMPATQWFAYNGPAKLNDGAGVARVGYILSGWQQGTTAYTLGETIPAITANMPLTATWSAPIIYPITYVMNGGTNAGANPATYTVESATITLVAPTRAGYVFLGWTPAGTIPAGSTGARTFTAAWSAPIAYNITYLMNGGVNAATNPGTYTVVSGLITLADPTRVGYDFLRWAPTDNIPAASTGARTFTATWSQPHVHTVTYYVNGGTEAGLDGATPYAVYRNVAYGAVVPVPNNPAQDEFTFDGWTSTIPVNMPDADVVLYGTMTRMPVLREIIPEQQTPLAGPTWALLNLILAIVTALAIISIFMLLKKRREVELTKRSKAFRWSTLVPAIGAIVAFLLTEDMSNPMVFTDQWTILMVGIAAVQVLVIVFGFQKKKQDA